MISRTTLVLRALELRGLGASKKRGSFRVHKTTAGNSRVAWPE